MHLPLQYFQISIIHFALWLKHIYSFLMFIYSTFANHIHTFHNSYIYNEFQKRGLPHVHILIFLHPQSKYMNPINIEKIISCEIPNLELHPRLYKLVKQHMMHVHVGWLDYHHNA